MKTAALQKRNDQWNDIRETLLRINPDNNYKLSCLMSKLIGYLEAKEVLCSEISASEILDEIYKMQAE